MKQSIFSPKAILWAIPVFFLAVPAGRAAEVLHSADSSAFRALFAPAADPHSFFYEVKPGDNLTAIAKKNHVTVDVLKKINALADDRLVPGQKLKIPSYKFSVVIDKSQNTLILKGDEEVLKTYVVSTGTDHSTPTGVFQVTDKLVNPTWYKAGAVAPPGSPENLLGTRWIGISKKGYGIHGTIEPEKLGQQVTAGCVRMRNEEVEELYGFVLPGTEVTIVD
ncbi:MAG: L,D-transpeptidase family protein [Candidatus Omnitrophica bacterium]|nr:L,D-transpeptidase family protein [Candidatus Omnitrophota bacterium]